MKCHRELYKKKKCFFFHCKVYDDLFVFPVYIEGTKMHTLFIYIFRCEYDQSLKLTFLPTGQLTSYNRFKSLDLNIYLLNLILNH